MKANEVFEKIVGYLSVGDIVKVSNDYKKFLNLSPQEGYDKTKEELDLNSKIKYSSDYAFWAQMGHAIVVKLIQAPYYHMLEYGEDVDIEPFEIPGLTATGSPFNRDRYFMAWVKIVHTKDEDKKSRIRNVLSNAIETYELNQKMLHDVSRAALAQHKHPYSKEEIDESFNKIFELDAELTELIKK
ncbi:hypothetical protein ACFL1H_04110 [Nanoarchaeota archaeon]